MNNFTQSIIEAMIVYLGKIKIAIKKYDGLATINDLPELKNQIINPEEQTELFSSMYKEDIE